MHSCQRPSYGHLCSAAQKTSRLWCWLWAFCLWAVLIAVAANAHAAVGTVTFTSAAGFSGSTVQDGQGGSTDILGINLQIINADGFSWTYETPYTQGAIAANYLASVPSSLITLKSSSTLVNFNLKSIFIADYGGGDITVRTYDNGNLVGTVNLTLNTGGVIYETTFNQSNGLTPSVFQNIDEVRFTPQGGGSMWIALNNIQIDNPVIIGPIVSTGTATAITSTSATLNGTVNPNGLSSTVSFDYGLTGTYGSNVAATVGGILSALLGDTAASVTITGLTCNTLYHFRTVGINLAATNNGADATFTTGPCVPGAPTIGTATPGDTQASVAFTAPVSNGGAAITSYTVTANPGGATGTGASSPVAVGGLSNGTAYTFTVTATNSAGTGAASAASNSITPKGAQSITFNNPGAQSFGTTPTLSATASSGLTVSFSSSTPAVCTVTVGGTLAFVSTGTCNINADQAGNTSFNAAPTVGRSFSVIAVVPGAPSIGTATAGEAQASVTFTAPAFTGGAAITGYTVTASPGGATGTGASSPVVVSGLSNGTSYTFTVTATNSAGTGSASAASNSVTPKGSQTITFANPGAQNFGTSPTLTATASSGLTVSFTSSTTGVCTITSGGALTFVTAGTCTINADQAGNTSFNAAPQVSQSFTVNSIAPGAPTIGTATAGDTQASVTFTAPGSNGGSAITAYTVTANPGGATGTGAASPVTVTGLTNGVAYTFTVTATNAAGTGAASAASNSITPAAGQTITFANPGAQNFGTSPTLTATASSGLTVSFTSSTTGVCTITSGGALTFVTTGTCTINADQAGNGSFSPAPQVSRSFTVNAVVPGAPTIGTATAGNTQASVAFTAPTFTGGTAITGYTVTANPGGATGTGATSPVTVTGLTNGVTYTFTATATNSAGTGAASAASNSVTPIAGQTITFNNPGSQVMGASPTLAATASSGLAVSFSATTPAVCSITSGGALTLISIGTCTINANQAGNGSFSAAPQVSQSFMVVSGSTTLALPGGGGNVAIAVTGTAAGCGLSSSQASSLSPAASSAAPGNLTFPYGMVSFNIAGSCANGSSATITLTYPQNLQANTQLWKYGRTSGNTLNHWYQLTAASNNVSITGNQISYTIVDGQNGDDDLTANGVIVDPAAPAIPMAGAGVASIPTLGEWAMALLAALLGAMTWHQRKRFAASH
jgi:hypothetical protein